MQNFTEQLPPLHLTLNDFADCDSDAMPKEIINMTLERKGKNEPWGFVIIGGKDQVGKLKSASS